MLLNLLRRHSRNLVRPNQKCTLRIFRCRDSNKLNILSNRKGSDLGTCIIWRIPSLRQEWGIRFFGTYCTHISNHA